MPSSYQHRQKVALLLIDVLAFLVAFVSAMHLRFADPLHLFEFGLPPWEPMLGSLPVMAGVWLFALWSSGMYQRRGVIFEFARLMQALLIMAGVLLSVTFFYRGFSYSRGFVALFIPAVLLWTFVGRVAFRVVRARLDSMLREERRVLLIGAGPVAEHFALESRNPAFPLVIVGALDDQRAVGEELAPGVKILGRPADLAEVAKAHDIRGVVVTDPKLPHTTQLELLEQALAAHLEFQVVPSAYELMLDRVQMHQVAGVPLLGVRRGNIQGSNRIVKRAFDLVAATTLLVLVSPLMALVALAIKLSSKGPILFSQHRVGENGRHFRFFKFRSMHVDNDDTVHREYVKKLITEGAAAGADGEGAIYKIARDPRLIPIGAFIRRYSVDELPQLFNVLKGDMSLIGPRPPIPYEVEAYREWHRRRFDGPPGITGLWQVSGRNRLSFDEMVKLDIEYLENWSFSTDLKILWRTMGVVLFDRAY
ncbi:MAG: sugar transferase [Myxococcales bacterium]|nr:sugar transferase [Myxococcales bacterium]MCB9651934.1 sugar transferase [Deltaproteobacteria bacterium]